MTRLVTRVREWETTAKVPPLAAGQVRPLVMPLPDNSPVPSVRYGYGALAEVWRNVRTEGRRNARPLKGAAETLTTPITQHLLYTDSIAFGNPLDVLGLDAIFERIREHKPGGGVYESYTESASYRQEVLGGINALAAAEKLVDANVVVIIPARLIPRDAAGSLILHSLYSKGDPDWDDTTDPLGSLTLDYGEIAEQSEVSEYEGDPFPVYRQGRVRDFGELVGAAVLAGSIVDVDVYLPSALAQRMLQIVVEKARLELRRSAGLTELQFLPTLLRLKIPRLADLALQDIVAIRRDGLFSRWHQTMNRGLEQVSHLPLDALLYDERATALIRAEAAEAVRDLEKEIHKSRLLTRARAGMLDMTVSSAIATAALLELTHGDPVSLTVAPAQAVAQMVLEWLRRRSRPGQKAFLRHAQLFEPSW